MSSGDPKMPLVIEYQRPDQDEIATQWKTVYRSMVRFYAFLAACSLLYYVVCFAGLRFRLRYYPAVSISGLENWIIDYCQSPLIPPILFFSGLIACTCYHRIRMGHPDTTALLAAVMLHALIMTSRIGADIYVLRNVKVPLLMQLRGSRGIQSWDAPNAIWDMLVCILFSIPLLLCPLSTLSKHSPASTE